jgi:hypothetical protein
MAFLHRIQWIDAAIREGRFPNADRIAEQFEISRRQALRDLEYMRDSLGAPVQYCPKRKGYYYTDSAFSVPGVLMTGEQQELLAGLAAHYEVLAEIGTRTSASETFAELSRLLLRLSGKPKSRTVAAIGRAADGILPFRAILHSEYPSGSPEPHVPSLLRPFYRGKNERQELICEFYHSSEFIPALLASGLTFSIVHPKWLRRKLVEYMDRIRLANQI